MSALHGPLPFNLVRAGAVAGWRYGLSCLGCRAGLMAAMVLVGMTSLGWTTVLAALVLIYKFAFRPRGDWTWPWPRWSPYSGSSTPRHNRVPSGP